MAPMYILARDIETRNISAAIKLRLVRTYDILHSRGSQNIKSRECVFHDEEGSYIHFHIPGPNVCVPNNFIEGHVYCIKNFLVITHFYTYKTCSSPFMLKYYHKTLVKEYKGCDFPRKMYRLQSFTSIKTLEGIDPNVLVDVIGRVVEIYSPLDKLISGRPARLIDFLIEDLKGNQLKCTFWDDHVEKILPFFRSDLIDPVIVLIQMCRVKVAENTGEVKISSSYDATQLLFNQDSIEFTEFRERLCMEQTPLKSITSNSSFSYGNYSVGDQSSCKMVISTLSDIFDRREYGEYWVPCLILGIGSDLNDWFYISCKSQGCNKKLVLKEGMYLCNKCGTNWHQGMLRYKIKIRVVDNNGNAPFILWDRESVELLGIKADELKYMQPKVVTKIPKEIQSLVGRGLLFKIVVRREQLENLHNAFPVMQIRGDTSLFNTYCPGLLEDKKKHCSDGLESIEDDFDSDEDFFSEQEDETTVQNALKQGTVVGHDTEAVKRSLLDEFSSTQSSRKKKHTTVKLEKVTDAADDKN